MRAKIDLLHEWVVVVDPLSQRHVEHGARRLSRVCKFPISYHTDDPEGVRELRKIEPEMLLERIFIREERLCKFLIHNCDVGGRFVVGLGETSATQNRLAQRLKVVCAHPVPGGT